MKSSNKFMGMLVLLLASQASLASFDLISDVKIVNHYPAPLRFKVKTISRHNTNFPDHFTLNSGDAISGEIVKKGSDARPIQEVFFYVNEVNVDGKAVGPNAFLGANVAYENGADLAVHKYDIDPYQFGIAYSWVSRSEKEPYTVITFCSEDEFEKHQHC